MNDFVTIAIILAVVFGWIFQAIKKMSELGVNKPKGPELADDGQDEFDVSVDSRPRSSEPSNLLTGQRVEREQARLLYQQRVEALRRAAAAQRGVGQTGAANVPGSRGPQGQGGTGGAAPARPGQRRGSGRGKESRSSRSAGASKPVGGRSTSGNLSSTAPRQLGNLREMDRDPGILSRVEAIEAPVESIADSAIGSAAKVVVPGGAMASAVVMLRGDANALRQAWLLKEIFGPPRSVSTLDRDAYGAG